MRIRNLLSAAMLGVVLTACYHQTVNTAPAPAGARVIDRPWQMSFVAGLVAPPEIDARAECGGPVARVQTQHSFLNSLVGLVTFGIVTPMRVIITCAGATSGIDQNQVIEAGDTAESRAAALHEAVRLSRQTGSAVFVHY